MCIIVHIHSLLISTFFSLQNLNVTDLNTIQRSSHLRCSFKEGILKNVAKLTGKQLSFRPVQLH